MYINTSDKAYMSSSLLSALLKGVQTILVYFLNTDSLGTKLGMFVSLQNVCVEFLTHKVMVLGSAVFDHEVGAHMHGIF